LEAPRKTILPPRRTSGRINLTGPANDDGFPTDIPPTDSPPAQAAASPATESPEPPAREIAPEAPSPRLALNLKPDKSQNDLPFDAIPRGRFQGEGPNVVDGEDLDLPPFLRKKS
jgi:cell division protein FtsZ